MVSSGGGAIHPPPPAQASLPLHCFRDEPPSASSSGLGLGSSTGWMGIRGSGMGQDAGSGSGRPEVVGDSIAQGPELGAESEQEGQVVQ